MRKFFVIFKKELRELITLRMILPFVMAMILMLLVGRTMRSEVSRASGAMPIGIADFDKTGTSEKIVQAFSVTGYVVSVIEPGDKGALIRAAIEQQVRVLIVIPNGFEQAVSDKKGTAIDIYSIVKSFSLTESIKRASLRGILAVMNQRISDDYIHEFDPALDPAAVKNPISAREYVVFKNRVAQGSAEKMLEMVMGQTIMIPVVLLMLIIFTGVMIASSVGQEKENKTLETLLTVPVSRFAIVTGKMSAAAVLALVFAGLYMLAMANYMSSMMLSEVTSQISSPTAQDFMRTLGLALDFKSNVLLGVNIFLAMIAALSTATLLALFARDAKDAQATIAPLMIVVLIPYFFSMIFDPLTLSLPLKIFIFIIPFSHTFFAMKLLLMGEYLQVILGILYLAVFSLGLLFIASRIFSSDKILTMKFSFFTGRRK